MFVDIRPGMIFKKKCKYEAKEFLPIKLFYINKPPFD